MAISDDTVVVGAIFNDGPATNSGAAYVFQRDQGGPDAWGQVAKLTALDASDEHYVGVAVAIAGDVAVVGTDFDDDKGKDAGAVYIFQRDQGGPDAWGQVAKRTASDGQADDWFGGAVAIWGDTLIVGASGDAGAVYVFERNHGGSDNWGEVAKRTAADGAAEDQLGRSVALWGDTLVAGALRHDGAASNAGAAYVFQRGQGGADNWGQVAKLTASDAEAEDRFGDSVGISGDTILVGATYDDDHGPESGAVYLFLRDLGGADLWGEASKLVASDDPWYERFGYSVAIDGETSIVGAIADDSNGPASGAAYVYGARCLTGSYCGPANLNSTGGAAVITACGSDVAVDNLLSLRAADLPPHQFGYFLASQTQGFVPFPGNSQGNLCLSGPIGRFRRQVQSSDSTGTFGILVDLTDLPPPLPQAVQPGETWNFQAWFRDKNPTPTSNFTDGVSITFL